MLLFVLLDSSADRCDSQRKQAKVPPVLLSLAGLQFERVDLIKVFGRILPVL